MATSRLCSIPDCGKPNFARGWCGAHWARWRKYGDPTGGGPTRGYAQNYFREVVLTYDGDECLIWPFGRINGYGHVRINGQPHLVHRLTCEEVHGPPPTPMHEAAHSCGKGKQGCVTKGHLDWKTHVENEADKIGHGTHSKGEMNGSAKLTEPEVRQIMALKGVMLQREIAGLFGVMPDTVGAIHRRERWAWLTGGLI